MTTDRVASQVQTAKVGQIRRIRDRTRSLQSEPLPKVIVVRDAIALQTSQFRHPRRIHNRRHTGRVQSHLPIQHVQTAQSRELRQSGQLGRLGIVQRGAVVFGSLATPKLHMQHRGQLEDGVWIGQEPPRVQLDKLDEAATELPLNRHLGDAAGPLGFPLGQQIVFAVFQRLPTRIVGRQPGHLALDADELALRIARLLQVVGVDQPGRIVVRTGVDLGQQGVAL